MVIANVEAGTLHSPLRPLARAAGYRDAVIADLVEDGHLSGIFLR
jgi:hypothetical protein